MPTKDQQTKAALVGINEVMLVLITHFKDGLVGEFDALYQKLLTDASFKATVAAAYSGYQQIPDEVKAFGVEDVCDLAIVELGYVPKFVAALHA